MISNGYAIFGDKNDKTNFLKFLIIIILLATISCVNTSTKSIDSNTNNEEVKTDNEEIEVKGEEYADSMVLRYIKEDQKEIIIDTAQVLNQLDCRLLDNFQSFQFSIDSLGKYEFGLQDLSPEAQLLFAATNCFAKIRDTDNYKMFVLYNRSNESHYSSSFDLLVIRKDSQQFQKIILAQQYGNELEDLLTSSIFKADNKILRKEIKTLRYIHGIGEVDSTEIKTESFFINKLGLLIKK